MSCVDEPARIEADPVFGPYQQIQSCKHAAGAANRSSDGLCEHGWGPPS